ncbi:Acidic mammalian chitinase [Portunus trituberculatus]|uniref:Acidic mammalian chitinase n=1 Tax=Portunus trituberculatus TaxID=210409 RepID=A0A5B7J0M2_PORTR|nr:Acidic mammalian chitinase [Portunus trituberculatus]
MVGYYGSWATYRPGAGKLSIDNIDPYICTHLIYAFAGVGYDNKIRVSDRVFLGQLLLIKIARRNAHQHFIFHFIFSNCHRP